MSERLKRISTDYYILDDENRPVRTPTYETYCQWFARRGNCYIRKTVVGAADVHTIFLSGAHKWGSLEPVFFDTTVFDGNPMRSECYKTYDDALAGHEQMVARVREAEGVKSLKTHPNDTVYDRATEQNFVPTKKELPHG